MEWTKQNILQFLTFVKERPAIWYTKTPDYRIKEKRHAAMKEVALLMGITTAEVNKKWTVLRNQFSREKSKTIGMRARNGADSIYKTKWFAYKAMLSLMSCNTPVSFKNNFEGNDSSPTPPPCSPTPPPQNTSTQSSLMSNSISSPACPSNNSGGGRKRKRRGDISNSIYTEAIQTLKFLRESENKIASNMDDDLNRYGLYIAAHLRKFPPRLQAKAKYEINNVLYNLDVEHLEEHSDSISSKDDNYKFSSR